MKITETALRRIVRSLIKESDHRWIRANDDLLMLDKEGMEPTDRENISKYLKSMRMID